MAQQQILGLDIGSETIKAVVAEPTSEGKILLKAGFRKPSRGLRKGVVVDMENATNTVGGLLDKVRETSKSALKNIYLRVGGSDVRVQSSRGITAVSRANSEIYRDDVDRVVQASEAVNLPPNRMILHTIKKEFIVDGVGDIQDPLGMTGSRLEVLSLIVDAFQPTIKNLSKCVELAGGSIGGLVFGPLAGAATLLTDNQKELGVISVDIGYGTTGIAIYEENKLLHTRVFPVGAGHITNDLAIALKIPVEVAEKVKLSYGYASAQGASNKEKVDLQRLDSNVKGSPSRKFISEVIESRLQEICELISSDLRAIDKERHLPAGIVITGGGAKLPGVTELFRDELRLATQVGFPRDKIFEAESKSMLEFIESPEYALVLGLVLSSKQAHGNRLSLNGGGVSKFFKNFFKNFLP
ncbi:MAG: Cell division protein ftsA [Parcubacteria group bacterium GW2011_GWB1_45_7]|uniref:Cell division protein FtsA n=2 Tax=Candidatus Colwelliibacteriota TaxID=1817904 RepID=A0A1G1ZCS0_9BACT|nr:MAG: Cell division protein ftsA [Parcubacteria group bacterium GW2011_GWB1_45_7]OGY57534.1 MAG: cell division protein FtsA [Candidatus Colwellbacteria bacterium RIFCSPHIGHO2_02_FULL_45_17]OGY60520.1 MAG: cell division protein FtsA [Candidatus Colwellbacteria bacterium RIFCSPLOWO2_02_FULL_45_11]OGY62421.1 MAG: cell division protein FtsA [Candidatus Colwellbacteria bacterium RIFCSPLOWO2_12_FULL_46_17]